MKSTTFFALTLFTLLVNAPAFAKNQAGQVAMVQIKSNGQTLFLDNSKVDNIQIKADKVVYDAATSTFNLVGKTNITINENRTHITHLRDSEATVRGSSHVELQIDAGSSIEVDQDAPIRELAAALKRDYPMINYRVQWYFSVFQYYSDGTALYDKKSGTLSEYIRQGDEEGGGIYRHFYRGVTDEILIKMAKDAALATNEANKRGSTAPFDFGQLARYGCTVVDVN